MKLGFITSILDGWSFDEVLDIASQMGYECLEVACWPKGKAERRYAGVSHIDAERLTQHEADEILDKCREKNIELSALAYYPNTLDPNPQKRRSNIDHLKKVIDASVMLGVNLVTTFIGRDQYKSVEENLKIVSEIWPEILHYAGNRKVKIAIENCPMLFGEEQWPGGQNLMTTPEIWKKVFEILPDDNLGINYDPSHFVWQMVDYIQPIYEFRARIFHVHYKDIKLNPKKLSRVGTMAYPLSYMSPKLPGMGDVDWKEFIKALENIEYDGYACVEVEDKDFEGSSDRILDSLRLSKEYIERCFDQKERRIVSFGV